MDNILIKFYNADLRNSQFGSYDPNDPSNPYSFQNRYNNIPPAPLSFKNIIRPLTNTTIQPKNLPIEKTIYKKPNTYDSIELSKSYTIPFKKKLNDTNPFQTTGNIISSPDLLKMQMLENRINELEEKNRKDNFNYKKLLESTIKQNPHSIIPNYRNLPIKEPILLKGINEGLYVISPTPINEDNFEDRGERRRRQIKQDLRNAREKLFISGIDSDSENSSRKSTKYNKKDKKDNINKYDEKIMDYIVGTFRDIRNDMQNKLNNLEQRQINDYNLLRQLLLEKQGALVNLNPKTTPKINYMDPLIELSSSTSGSNNIISFHDDDNKENSIRKHYIKLPNKVDEISQSSNNISNQNKNEKKISSNNNNNISPHSYSNKNENLIINNSKKSKSLKSSGNEPSSMLSYHDDYQEKRSEREHILPFNNFNQQNNLPLNNSNQQNNLPLNNYYQQNNLPLNNYYQQNNLPLNNYYQQNNLPLNNFNQQNNLPLNNYYQQNNLPLNNFNQQNNIL